MKENHSTLPDQTPVSDPAVDAELQHIAQRNKTAQIWYIIFQASTAIGILVLTALLINILNSVFGYVALEYKVDPASLSVNGKALEDLSQEEYLAIIKERVSSGVQRRLESEKPLQERSREELHALVVERVVAQKVIKSWTLFESWFAKADIETEMAKKYAKATLKFKSWLSSDFITSPQSSDATLAGVRTAILGSLWTIAVAILFAFPIGVGASIYLEEYAEDNWFNRVIQTNITNLAGVPSIIYGMLGLAVFVRAMEVFTSGAFFGVVNPTTANGRTIISAGLTLGILVLPILIINGQEAIRAVPNSLRYASFGVGATRWQTIWHHVLPNALPGILTGTILAISRAIGETAPLVVVGASTFITFDPEGPFSKFTTLPIQIYQWTSRPQDVFRNIAAAGIIILLVLLLSMNAIAIILRNRYSKQRN